MEKLSYVLVDENTAIAFNKQVGDTVELVEKHAKPLVDAGKIEAGSDTKEDKKAAARADKTDKTAIKTK